MCVTCHGQAAAAGPALILAQLSVQFGLGGGGRCRRQVGVTQLPEEEGRGGGKLLLEGRGRRGQIRLPVKSYLNEGGREPGRGGRNPHIHTTALPSMQQAQEAAKKGASETHTHTRTHNL